MQAALLASRKVTRQARKELGELERLGDLLDAIVSLRVPVAAKIGEQDEVLPYGDRRVDPGLLRGQTHLRGGPCAACCHVDTGDAHATGVGVSQSRHDGDECRLARTVRAEQSTHLTGLDAEAHAVERDAIAITLHDRFDVERRPRICHDTESRRLSARLRSNYLAQ